MLLAASATAGGGGGGGRVNLQKAWGLSLGLSPLPHPCLGRGWRAQACLEAPRRSWAGSQELTVDSQPHLSCSRSRGQIKIWVWHSEDGVDEASAPPGGFWASLASGWW